VECVDRLIRISVPLSTIGEATLAAVYVYISRLTWAGFTLLILMKGQC